MFAIGGLILNLYKQLHLWITSLYIFNWVLQKKCIIWFFTIVFARMSTKSSDMECYIKVLVSYDPSISIAANDNVRDMNIVRLTKSFIRFVNWRDPSGIQYNDDADTAALLLIKSSQRQCTPSFLTFQIFFSKEGKLCMTTIFSASWLRGAVRIILCSQQICKFIYCYAI